MRFSFLLVLTLAVVFAVAGASLRPALAQEPTGTEEEAAADPTDGDDAADEGMACDESRCEQAGTSFWITIVSVDALAILAAFIFWWFFNQRRWWNATACWLAAAFLAASIAETVISLNPFATDVFDCCLLDGNFAQYIVLSGVAPWMRGFVLGAVPTIAGFFLVFIVKKLLER